MDSLGPSSRDIGDIFKSLVWDALVKLVIARLVAALPFLGWGPIGIVVGWIVGIAADQLYEALRMAVQIEVIVMRNAAHQKAFETAAVALKIIAYDKGVDSPEFKEAREKHREALSKFVQFG